MLAIPRLSATSAVLLLLVGCSAGESQPSTTSLVVSSTAVAATTSTASATTSTAATTTTVAVPAQWMWAWLQEPAQIVAVNTDGRSNHLVDTPDPVTLNNFGLWQVGDEAAVAMYMDGATPTVYVLTTTDATQVDFPAVDMAVPENGWSLVAVSDPYLVVRYSYGVSEAAVLIDTQTAAATLLSAGVADLPRAALFSADGRFLRYVTTSGDGSSSNVLERDLTTGADRTLYSYSNYDHVLADANGDVWLDFRTGDVIAADGRPTNDHRSVGTGTGLWLTGEWTMTYSYACTQDCPLTMTPVFGTEPTMTYVIPQKTASTGLASWLLADESLLVLDSATDSYWRLPPDGAGELLGHGDPYQTASAVTRLPYTVFSTDVGEPVGYGALLDRDTGEIIPLPVVAESKGEFWLDGQRDGLLLTQYKSDGTQAIWVLPNVTRTFAQLTTDPLMYCVLLLGDGSAICYSDGSGGDGGIYRYDPASDTTTQISDLAVYSLSR